MNKSILLVEDEVLISMMEKTELESIGYCVETVSSGEEAVEYINAHFEKTDLILMDIDLGDGIDGTETARQILSLYDIPVVFLSSHKEPEIVEKTEKITSYGYVVKNSGIVVLDASIKMAFKLYEAHNKSEISEKKYRLIFENAPIGIVQYNNNGIIEDYNDSYLGIFKSKREILDNLNIFNLKDENLINAVKKTLSNEVAYYEGDYHSIYSDHVTSARAICFPLLEEDGSVIGGVSLVEDVTEHNNIQKEIDEVNKKNSLLSAVVENSDNIVVIKDLDLRVLATNQAFANAAGHESVDTMIGKTDAEIFGVSPESEPVRSYMEDERKAQTLKKGECLLREEPVITHTGEKRIVLTKKYPIYDDEDTLIATGNISVDITDRKNAEKKVVQQLEEMELLVKETHHRIKNNISTISNLLKMQIQNETDGNCKNILQDAVTRVESMGMLYEKLLMGSGYKTVSIREYTKGILNAIVKVYPEKSFKIDERVDDFEIDTKRVVAIGILINEFITNSMKYAFSEKSKGQIQLELIKNNDTVFLILKDNGPGLPSETLQDNPDKLGLMLIKMMAEQLYGNIIFENDNGLKLVLDFKI